MKIDPSDILVFCCHIKRNLFFEDTMRLMKDKGFNRIWIQQTGRNSFGSYQGPQELSIANNRYPVLWNTALQRFQQETNKGVDYKYIFLADFDLFFSHMDEFMECLDQLGEGEYDHVSRFKSPHYQPQYDFKGKQIVEVPKIEIFPGNIDHDWPQLEPHFATGYEFFSKKLWDGFTHYELGDGRRMYRAAVQRKMKMGAHKATYGVGEKCWGKEWFHVSNLTAYYQMIDANNFSKLRPGNIYDEFRIGFFAAQEKFYGENIYSPEIKKRLEQAYIILGGKDKCLAGWNKEIEGTCMEGWKPYA